MEFLTFSILVIIMSIIYLGIGYKTAKKVHSLNDFFLAGKNVGIFALSMSLIATQLGGGAILGTSQEAYSNGYIAFAYIVGICLGFLLLAAGFAQKIRNQNVDTIAQIFEKRYNSPFLTKVASIASVLSLTGVLVAQMVGSKSLLIALNIYSFPLFFALWAAVISYTMMGGLKAVIDNNTLQLLFILTVFIGIFLFDRAYQPTVLAECMHTAISTSIFDQLLRFFTIALTPALFSLFEQDIAQTIIAAKDQKTVFWGTISAAIAMIAFAYIPFYFGIQAACTPELAPHITAGAQPLMTLISYRYGTILQLFVAYGVLAAILSTANSLLCAISSHITLDFHLARAASTLWVPKIVTLIVGSAAFLLALSNTSILDILISSYLIPISTIFIPIIAAYFCSRVSTNAAYVSCILGGLYYLATAIDLLPNWSIWLMLCVNTGVFMLITRIEKQRKHISL